jgi:tRNA threonylcarbamoyladenosine biosynthesis protein TsaE
MGRLPEERKKLELYSGSPDDTRRIGRCLGTLLQPGDIVALMGELGTGKTCLTQGIASGLDIPPAYAVTSPTFTLINEYPGRHPLYHIDVYRLSGPIDMEDLGYEEIFYGRGVVVIEWAEKIAAILPRQTVKVELVYTGAARRRITVLAMDSLVDRLQQLL